MPTWLVEKFKLMCIGGTFLYAGSITDWLTRFGLIIIGYFCLRKWYIVK